jgi:beta-galactosidase
MKATMVRTVCSLNRDWLYCPRDSAGFARTRCATRGFTRVHLPHSNVEVPVNYFSEQRTQFVSWYRKGLPTPTRSEGACVFVDFDGVMMVAEVYVNGHLAHTHRGGYVGFSVDVTSFLRRPAGANNVMAIRVDSRLDPGVPPCGHVMDYQAFGGIYRDVRLRVTPLCFISDVFVRTPQSLAPRKTVVATATVRNVGSVAWDGTARLELLDGNGQRTASGPAIACQVPPRGESVVDLSLRELRGIEPWDLDTPRLYRARVTLHEGRRRADQVDVRFGFRDAVFTRDGPFLLNGRPVKLLGLNRHQTYPTIGAAAPARLQRRDADILRYDLGTNIVRTSHYPQSPHFLRRPSATTKSGRNGS